MTIFVFNYTDRQQFPTSSRVYDGIGSALCKNNHGEFECQKDEREKIKVTTRSQWNSSEWFATRTWRITGSTCCKILCCHHQLSGALKTRKKPVQSMLVRCMRQVQRSWDTSLWIYHILEYWMVGCIPWCFCEWSLQYLCQGIVEF